MDFNTWMTENFHWLDLPEVSTYVAFWCCAPFVVATAIFSWCALRTKQSIQVVHVNESLPEAADLISYLVKKARAVGNEQVANYLLAFELAGNVGGQDKLQQEGIKFLGEVTRHSHPQMSAELMESAMRIMT